MNEKITLCPNCGSVIYEDDLNVGCWTCGFSMKDVQPLNDDCESENKIKKIEEKEDAE